MTMILAALALASGAPANEPIIARTAIESAATQATIHEVVLPADPDQVWRAIATPEGWRTWAAPVVWVDPGDPTIIQTSYDRTAKPGDGSTISQRVLLTVPQRIIAFRTIKAPNGFPNFEALAQVSWVFEIMPEGPGKSRVRLTGSGYPRTEAGDQVRSFFERGNVISLEFMRQRFEQGPIDWATQGKRAAAVAK